MTRPLLAAALSAALFASPAATPALADNAMLNVIASGMVGADRPLTRAYAICLLGAGQIDPVAEGLAEMGFQREDDTEMGVTYLAAPDAPYSVALYQDGAICDVTSETNGTDEALMSLVVLGGMTGFENVDTECTAMRLGGVLAEVTSSGNDPDCYDDDTSNVRFTFGN
ncbi:MAG: hypothetical protein ACK4GW_15650 [Pseudorhodobacter sp.]